MEDKKPKERDRLKEIWERVGEKQLEILGVGKDEENAPKKED